jgi:hypothetical protein
MRTNKVSLVVGTRGTGKTDFVKNGLSNAIGLRKQLIVDTFDSPAWHNLKTFLNPHQENIKVSVMPLNHFAYWKSGRYRIFSADTALIMQLIQQHAYQCTIVFEDATKYIGSKLTRDMQYFVLDSKQKDLDLIFIFHSLGQIPPDLIRVADNITLFKTNDRKVPAKTDFPEIEKAFKSVNAHPNRYYSEFIQLN